MAFPTQPVLDSFHRANENPLTTVNWSTGSFVPGDGQLQVSSSQCANVVSVGAQYWINNGTADCEVYATVKQLGNNQQCFLRANIASSNCYLLDLAATGVWTIYKESSGTFTSLGSTTLAFANGDQYGFEASGTNLRAYKNGTLAMSLTDASYGSGGPFGLRLASAAVDNFGGGPTSTSNAGSGMTSQFMLVGVGV